MATRIQYNVIIEKIINSKDSKFIITQKLAKQVLNNELPKSCFNKDYLRKGNNELGRFLIEKGYYFEVTEPKIIIYKNKI